MPPRPISSLAQVISVSCGNYQQACEGTKQTAPRGAHAWRATLLSKWARPDFVSSAMQLVHRLSVPRAWLCAEGEGGACEVLHASRPRDPQPNVLSPTSPSPSPGGGGSVGGGMGGGIMMSPPAAAGLPAGPGGGDGTIGTEARLAQFVRGVPLEHSLAVLAIGPVPAVPIVPL